MASALRRKAATAQLVVRNFEPAVKTRLQKRAKKHGRSMEEEVRDILRDAVKKDEQPKDGLGTRIANRFKKIGLRDDEEIREWRGFPIRPAEFEE